MKSSSPIECRSLLKSAYRRKVRVESLEGRCLQRLRPTGRKVLPASRNPSHPIYLTRPFPARASGSLFVCEISDPVLLLSVISSLFTASRGPLEE